MSSKLEFSRGEVIAEKYEVTDHLDESPLGLTYRVKHLRRSIYVRLLVLRPELVGRDQKDQLIDIHRRMRAIDHAGVLAIGELGEHEGLAFVTFEDFDGHSMRHLLNEYRNQQRQLGVKEAAQITAQLLEAAQALNEGGAPIRALRPEYVLVNVRYTGPRQQNLLAQCKIFGGLLWELVPPAVLAEDEFNRGEAQYLAPELKSFNPKTTQQCDVYSIGVMLYEMLVGSPPVGTFQLPRARRADLPSHLDDVLELALAASREDRYPSLSDFQQDLSRTFADAAVETNAGRPPLITPLGWGLLVAIVAVLVLLLFLLRGDPEVEARNADIRLRSQVLEQQERLSAEERKAITDRHPPNMVYIPGGSLLAGRLNAEPAAFTAKNEPLAEVRPVPGFLIDVFEFPNLPDQPPLTALSAADAEQKCQQVGKRLCTADEWEKACKGPKSQPYSYGDEFNAEACGGGISDLRNTGTRSSCTSAYGVFDLSGNVAEWTSSVATTDSNRRIVKGGSAGAPEKTTRCASMNDESAGYSDKMLGFRCCRNVDAPPVGP